MKNKDGSLHARPYCWSGGRPYKICPRRQYEKFETENQKKIKALGFEGIHYIDVITILPILKCYDKNHPTNKKEGAEWYRKTMKLARETFGGFSSESGYDFAAEYLDYAMYSNFAMGKDEKIPMSDEIVPFWHLVYHGIILYNPCTFTLNYPAKGEKNRLKLIELGGRPLICYYANFATDNRWMGDEDFCAIPTMSLIKPQNGQRKCGRITRIFRIFGMNLWKITKKYRTEFTKRNIQTERL